jgi:hypothetical protein
VTVSFFERTPKPDELVIRNRSVTRMMDATRTISPTFNCDQRTSCWLGIALLFTQGPKGGAYPRIHELFERITDGVGAFLPLSAAL